MELMNIHCGKSPGLMNVVAAFVSSFISLFHLTYSGIITVAYSMCVLWHTYFRAVTA